MQSPTAIRARKKTTAAGVALAAALVFATGGCGGGDDGGDEAAATASELVSCLDDAGYDAASSDPAGVQSGLTGGVEVPASNRNAVIVTFFDNAEDAATFDEDQATFLQGAGAGGDSELVTDTIVLGYARSGAEQEIAAVRTCLGV